MNFSSAVWSGKTCGNCFCDGDASEKFAEFIFGIDYFGYRNIVKLIALVVSCSCTTLKSCTN